MCHLEDFVNLFIQVTHVDFNLFYLHFHSQLRRFCTHSTSISLPFVCTFFFILSNSNHRHTKEQVKTKNIQNLFLLQIRNQYMRPRRHHA